MREEEINRLFTLFSGADSTEYASLIAMSILQVQDRLIDETETDYRLNALAAALANLQYVNLTATQERPACTIGGSVTENTEALSRLNAAKELCSYYEAQCTEYLYDTDFTFQEV